MTYLTRLPTPPDSLFPPVLLSRLPHPSSLLDLFQRPAFSSPSSIPHSYRINIPLESLLFLSPSRLSKPRSRPSHFFELSIFLPIHHPLVDGAHICIVSRCSHYLDSFVCPVIPRAAAVHLNVALILTGTFVIHLTLVHVILRSTFENGFETCIIWLAVCMPLISVLTGRSSVQPPNSYCTVVPACRKHGSSRTLHNSHWAPGYAVHVAHSMRVFQARNLTMT